jgi:hypothetical protein
MADLSQVVLTEVGKQGEIDTLQLAGSISEDHQKIVGAVKSLQSLGDVRFSIFQFMMQLVHTTFYFAIWICYFLCVYFGMISILFRNIL